MDCIKLADLLYPSVTKTTEYWEKKYPPRELPSGSQVTRFAPSPTGYLHMGHFYGAQTDFCIAKSTGGVFFFRLEDTDKKRELKGAENVALEVLEKYGIVPDEGLMKNGEQKGAYGPYRQTERLEIYHTFAKKLVAEGKAFPCFCEKAENKQEILERREENLSQAQTIDEKDCCRDLTFEEIENNIKLGKKFALRLKSNGTSGDRIKFCDVVRGEREAQANCKDVVLLKSDGIPPYAFAHAIDDHLMKTTIVVRGEEWLSTLPQHIEIFDALGFDRVKYIHTPLICKVSETGGKRKLSKRLDPEADMRFFLSAGYPVETVNEYILNLLNSNFELWRAKNPQAPISEFGFDIKKIGTSSPFFDLAKLEDISKNIISLIPASQLIEKVLVWAKEYDNDFYAYLLANKEYVTKVLKIDRENAKPRKDIAKWSDIKTLFAYMFEPFKNLSEYSDFELEGETRGEHITKVLKNYAETFNLDDDKQSWFDRIKNMAEKLGFATDNKLYKQNPENYVGNTADVCTFIRLALTGRKNSPDIYEIMKILGKEEVKARLLKLAKIIEKGNK